MTPSNRCAAYPLRTPMAKQANQQGTEMGATAYPGKGLGMGLGRVELPTSRLSVPARESRPDTKYDSATASDLTPSGPQAGFSTEADPNCAPPRTPDVPRTQSSDEARLEAFLVKRKCYRVYRQALRSGRLTPGPCFADGPDCRGKKGNGHHHDYRQPLDVVWCCLGHHVALDRLRRAGHSLASAMVEVLLIQGKSDAA